MRTLVVSGGASLAPPETTDFWLDRFGRCLSGEQQYFGGRQVTRVLAAMRVEPHGFAVKPTRYMKF
jgi:hypothetical protein